MADVTTTFAAKDESFASTVDRLQQRLTGFAGETTSFSGKVEAMGASFSRLATPLLAAGAAFLGAQSAAQAFRDALSMAGRLDDLSKATGATAGELAVLSRAFELGGSSADKLGPILQRLNAFLGEAVNPASAQAQALSALGLTYADLQAKSPAETLQILMQRLAAIEEPTVRAAAAQQIFKKAAVDIAPMIESFSGELSQARQQLGSLPQILNESGASMAEFGDSIDGIGKKFSEFVIGLIAGASGAKDLAAALSTLDAAGFGQGIGNTLRTVFSDLGASAKALGYTLETSFKQAGNALASALTFSASIFGKMMLNMDFIAALRDRISSVFMETVNLFNKTLASGIKTVLLEPLARIPGIIGDPFRAALASVEKIQATLDATSARNYATWKSAGQVVEDSFNDAVNSTQIIDKDFFNAQGSADKAASFIMQAQEAAAKMPEDAKTTEKHSEGVSKNTTDAKAALEQALEAMKGTETSSDKVSKNGAAFANSIKEAESASEKLAENLSGPKSLSGLDARAQKESGDLREALGRLRDYVKEDGAMRQYNREQDSAQRTLDRKLDEAAKLRERGFDFAAAEKEARARDQFTQKELASRYDLLSKTKLQDDLERAARKQSYGEELEARRKAFNEYEERQKRAGDYVNEKMRDAANRSEEALLDAANDFFSKSSAGGGAVKGGGSDAGGYMKDGGAAAAAALRDAVGLKAGHKPWFSGGGELDFIKDLKAQGKGRDPMASAMTAINKALETLTKYIVSDDRLPQNAIGY
jgi:hypothetical protein